MIPKIAIVGRPNVGKSTLFNWLIEKRIAIEDPTAGVTRDRLVQRLSLEGRTVDLVDTGGMGFDDPDGLTTRIDAQVVAGVLTAEKAAERKAGLPEHIDRFLAHVHGAPPPAAGGRRGMNPPPGIAPTPPAVTSSAALDPVRSRGQDRPARPGGMRGPRGPVAPQS